MLRQYNRPLLSPQNPTLFLIIGAVLTLGFLFVMARGPRTQPRSLADDARSEKRRPQTGDGEVVAREPALRKAEAIASRSRAERKQATRARPHRSERPSGDSKTRETETRRSVTPDFDALVTRISGQQTTKAAAARAPPIREPVTEIEPAKPASPSPPLAAESSRASSRFENEPRRVEAVPPSSPLLSLGDDRTADDRSSDKRKEKKEPPDRPPRSGYARRLKEAIVEKRESGGLSVTVRVIPDAYRFAMARDMEEFERAGYRGKELQAALKKLHSKHRVARGRAVFSVSIDGGGSGNYYFLQSSLKKCVEVKQRSRRSVVLGNEEPKLRSERWSVFELRPDEPRRVYKKVLARFERLKFDVRSRLNTEEKTPIQLVIGNIVQARSSKSKNRDDALEGVSLSQRQISTSGWDRLVISPIEFRFYPGSWELPREPEEFTEIIEWLGG